jgi:hypothetical protein
METLFAIAVAVGILKGSSAPQPPPQPKGATIEQRQAKSAKPRRNEPSLGY